MNRENLERVLLIMLGFIPLLWWKPGYIIAKGDHFPLWLNPQVTLYDDVYLWSPQNAGNPSIMSSFILHGFLWFLLKTLRFDVGFIQIIFQVFLFMSSGFLMYYLSKTVYPKQKLSPIFSSVFYMFNFFVLKSRLKLGFTLAYTFLPLLVILLIKIMDFAIQKNDIKTNKYIVFFCIALTTTFSLASVNLANIVLIFLVLAIIFLYKLILQRNQIRPIFLILMKIMVLSFLLNIWWIVPAFNYYLWSPTTLNPTVSVTSWSWTHQRASFLNLFWLNGGWDWRPEYYPYYDSYSNPILVVLSFVPLMLAASAILVRKEESRFNIYLMSFILILFLLAKGLHEPFGLLNLLIYKYIPGMTMFREPTSKFTMALIPFIALLIGYSADHIVDVTIIRNKTLNLTKTLIALLIISTFLIVAYPLFTNPLETRTQQIPFSSYVKIPDYWHQTIKWFSNQNGDYKILITPPDDFYQIPYSWGYYGTDQFIERLINKPIISNHYKYSYKTNPDIVLTLQQLSDVMKYNRTDEFRALLDLYNIKYILQRNDVMHNFTDRKIIPPEDMQTFLTRQPYIRLTQKYGQLDIYEYMDPKPYIYVLDPTASQQIAINIENKVMAYFWEFNSQADTQEWQENTLQNQFGTTQYLYQDSGTLKVELWNSTWGWKTINAPPLPARYGDTYQIRMDIKGQNVQGVHIKMIELDKNNNFLTNNYVTFINDGTFDWINKTYTFEPTNKTTKFIQLQILHGHETNKPIPNTIWIDNVNIQAYSTILNTEGLDLLFRNSTQYQPARISSYQKINPTKTMAVINATKPFILVVSEALDNSWTAYTERKRYKPRPLYLSFKGFDINETGLIEVTIEYEPQKLFNVGCAISLSSFLLCITYLSIGWTRNKSIWIQLKRKHQKIILHNGAYKGQDND